MWILRKAQYLSPLMHLLHWTDQKFGAMGLGAITRLAGFISGHAIRPQ